MQAEESLKEATKHQRDSHFTSFVQFKLALAKKDEASGRWLWENAHCNETEKHMH